VTNEVQHDLDKLGIAKTAREEKMRARDQRQKKVQEEENAKMLALYRKHVLNEPELNLVQIGGANGGIQSAAQPAPEVEKREEIGSFGD
jgi:2-phosphoglycerate kinase